MCRGGIIGFCRFLDVDEEPEVNVFAVNMDLRHPSVSQPMPRYSTIAGSVGTLNSVIGIVLRLIALSQIGAAIVESVVVAMVGLLKSGDPSVHENALSAFSADVYIPHGIEGFCVRTPHCAPAELTQRIKIIGINNSVLALRERNKFDRLIERLDNDVSDHTLLHGNLTSCAAFSRFCILAGLEERIT